VFDNNDEVMHTTATWFLGTIAEGHLQSNTTQDSH